MCGQEALEMGRRKNTVIKSEQTAAITAVKAAPRQPSNQRAVTPPQAPPLISGLGQDLNHSPARPIDSDATRRCQTP